MKTTTKSPPEEEEEDDTTETTDSVPSNGSKSKAAEGEEEEAGEKGSDGVKVPEEFQRQAYSLVNSASKEECDYLRDCCYEREDVLRKEQRNKELKENKNKPNAVVKFTDEDMPPSGY